MTVLLALLWGDVFHRFLENVVAHRHHINDIDLGIWLILCLTLARISLSVGSRLCKHSLGASAIAHIVCVPPITSNYMKIT